MEFKLFAEKLRQLRRNKHWSQEEAYKKIGIAISTLRNYELGRPPHLSALKRIVETFGVTYDYLLDDNIPIYYPKASEDPFIVVLGNILQLYDSQNKMAEAFEMSSSYLTKIFQGRYKNISPNQLRKIADNSKGVVTYLELMRICGYITKEDINNKEKLK